MPEPEPLRSPVEGTLEAALEVALAHQRAAAAVHETWPMGIGWAAGAGGAWLQWAHDLPGEEAPAGWLGLLEAGLPGADVEPASARLAPLGFEPEPTPFGTTSVLAWSVPDEQREVGAADLLALLARCARAAGAPDHGRFELYPDAAAAPPSAPSG